MAATSKDTISKKREKGQQIMGGAMKPPQRLEQIEEPSTEMQQSEQVPEVNAEFIE